MKNIRHSIPLLIGAINWILSITFFTYMIKLPYHRILPVIYKVMDAYLFISIIPPIIGVVLIKKLSAKSPLITISYLVNTAYLIVYAFLGLIILILRP